MKNKGLVFLLVFCVLFIACKEKKTDIEFRIVLSSFFEAVNTQDNKKLSSNLILFDEMKNRFGDVGGTIAEFSEKIESINRDYEIQRNSGQVKFD